MEDYEEITERKLAYDPYEHPDEQVSQMNEDL